MEGPTHAVADVGFSNVSSDRAPEGCRPWRMPYPNLRSSSDGVNDAVGREGSLGEQGVTAQLHLEPAYREVLWHML